MHAGKAFGAALFGAFAMNSMRLEKGYRAWGADLSTERTPIEVGLRYRVKLDDRNFEGRDALAAHVECPGQMRMVLLEITCDDLDPFYGHPVVCGDAVVGLVRSGAYGHRTRKKLALAYLLAVRDELPGCDLAVQILDQVCPARILPRAPYDPNNERLRS
jgi:dimethylglycine dehydrogenase